MIIEAIPPQHAIFAHLGPDYKFEGHVYPGDERHEHLVSLNNVQSVAIHSFTSQSGIKFHHAIVGDEEKSDLFNRFEFANPDDDDDNDTTISKRQDVEETSNEYFKTGSLDLFDCAVDTSSQALLNAGDANDMTNLIKCNDPNFPKATELSIQVHDEVGVELPHV
jgi:hypothetical protein